MTTNPIFSISPHPLLLLSLSLSLSLLLSLSPPSLAAQCPAFTAPHASCGANTCGHFVFKGRFDLGASRVHRIKEARNGLRLGPKAAPADCCKACRGHESCVFWNFVASNGACYLYSSQLCASDPSSSKSPYTPNIEGSFVGGRCHDASEAATTMTAAAGLAPVSFPMLPERTFCLLSDPEMHINMKLGGYLDERAAVLGAAKPRVWIREIGFLWKGGNGQQHSLRMVARKDPKQERGDGFLDRIEVDGTAVPTMMLGDEVNLFEGQASILFESHEKSGPVDVDRYSIRLENILEADIYARPAHPLLQHKEEAMVHLNLDIGEVHHSVSVHGVLGQTYHAAKESEESNLDYNVLSQLISGSAASKVPFKLQGRAEDYWSSAILAPDCKFTQFGKAAEEDKSKAAEEDKSTGPEEDKASTAAGEGNAADGSEEAQAAALVKEAEEEAEMAREVARRAALVKEAEAAASLVKDVGPEDEVAIEVVGKDKSAKASAGVAAS